MVSPQLISELERVLTYPKLRRRIGADESAELLSLIEDHAELHADLERPQALSVDPKDDYLIALASASGAVLVSGDRHLLDLADRAPIESPRAFLDRFP